MSAPRALSLARAATAILAVLVTVLATAARAQMCGSQAGGALCPNCLCCSEWGYCGSTDQYCGIGCQSQCDGGCAPPAPAVPPPPAIPPPPAVPSPPAGPGLESILSRELFEEMLLHRNNAACPARGFYTYDRLLVAAAEFPEFAEGQSTDTRKREVAAFLAQTSHETTGGWPTAPDGPYAWGYCFKREVNPSSDYCDASNSDWPCAPGKRYYGRGPMQLSWNYNYGQAGRALGLDLLGNPDLVETDDMVSFETALWFWMTPQGNKPSSHAVITDQWTPSPADIAANRVPGYGVITNIINGGLECGIGPDPRVADRIGFYKRYCDLLGVSYGPNLDCDNQKSFAWGLSAGLAAQQ
ncbi:hypothetical protein ACQ4PT_010300 [Festuca glaucescens]